MKIFMVGNPMIRYTQYVPSNVETMLYIQTTHVLEKPLLAVFCLENADLHYRCFLTIALQTMRFCDSKKQFLRFL